MVIKLAIRNLFHDRARFLVTLVGILFAVVLIAVQLGMYFGARRMITGMVDHTNADIWIAKYGAESFEQAQFLTGRERFAALSVPGVEAVTPLLVSFAEWRRPDTSTTNVVVIGSGENEPSLRPWDVIEGATVPASPDGVIIDRTYAKSLGIPGAGSTGEILGKRVRVEGLTSGIRSFTTSPFVFTSMQKARTLLSIASDQATFYLVKLAPGAAAAGVKHELELKLHGVSIYTKEEFRQRNLNFWLFGTGAGVALLGGAVLGLIIGTVIVAQTLYSSTKDHLTEFATLRALGSSSLYIHKVILTQATVSAIAGYALGIVVAILVGAFSGQSALPIVFTPALAAFLFAVTVAMCAISAVSSILKVTKIDPAMVFAR
jgi:putative ABC transport system permease protein